MLLYGGGDLKFVNLQMSSNTAFGGNDIYETGTSYTCHSLCERGHYDSDCDFADASSSYLCAINCGSKCTPCLAGRASNIAGAVFETDCEVFKFLQSFAHI